MMLRSLPVFSADPPFLPVRLALAGAALCAALPVFSQFSTGTWRDHLPYGQAIDVCVDEDDVVYCATPYSLFSYDQVDGDTRRISKVNELSDVGLSAIEYDSLSKSVIIGYENGNLDILFPSGGVNIPDIKASTLIGDKKIYDILPYGEFAYLSTGFGVVVLDLNKFEVKNTFIIGQDGAQERINDIDIADGMIYAATDNGVKVADLSNPFLSNFQNWDQMDGLPTGPVKDIEFFVGYMFLNVGGEVQDAVWRKPVGGDSWEVFAEYPNLRYTNIWASDDWMTFSGDGVYQVFHFELLMNLNETNHAGADVKANMAVMDEWGACWIADERSGLLWKKNSGDETIIRPQGPAQASARRLSCYNNNLWVAHGGINDSWGNFWNKAPLSGFVNESWKSVGFGSGTNGTDGVNDFMDCAVDPLDNDHVYYGSWEEGLVELKPNGATTTFNAETGNGPIQGSGFEWAQGWTGVAGVTFDINGIMFCTNSFSEEQVHARDRNGTFYSFDFAPELTEADRIGDIEASQLGYVWAIVPSKGIVVLSTNGTLGSQSDDNFKLLTDDEGNGGLPSPDVYCMQEDLDGEMWIGTLQGLAVFYNQDAIFSEENFDCEQILITQDGNVQVLLETEAVTAIEIDGGNRKWVGTQNSGVFLFSPDGLRQIYHFTEKNSPLLSNNIFDIAINQENGEVFFATEKGIVSFFSTATNFDQEMSDVRAYPNPVRPEYSGNITIDGLAYNSSVKITDLQGNLVFETESQGGRAVWNGKMLNGERPASGVYLVFAATQDGTVDNVGKITFIH